MGDAQPPPNDINNNPHLRKELLRFLNNDMTLEESVKAANLHHHAKRARSPIGFEKLVGSRQWYRDQWGEFDPDLAFQRNPGGDIRRKGWYGAVHKRRTWMSGDGDTYQGPFFHYGLEGQPADDDPEYYPVFPPEIEELRYIEEGRARKRAKEGARGLVQLQDMEVDTATTAAIALLLLGFAWRTKN